MSVYQFDDEDDELWTVYSSSSSSLCAFTFLHLFSGLLIGHPRIRTHPQTEGLPQQNSITPHITLWAVTPCNSQPQSRRHQGPITVTGVEKGLYHPIQCCFLQVVSAVCVSCVSAVCQVCVRFRAAPYNTFPIAYFFIYLITFIYT